MIRRLAILGLFVGLLASCSDRERTVEEAAEWAEIEALADNAQPEAASNTPQRVAYRSEVPAGEYAYFVDKLAEMKTVVRGEGETLLTGKTLVFDHNQLYVRMDDDVVVDDDQGEMRTQSLIGRFSASNELQVIEATGGVDIASSNRTARADEAFYNYETGFVRMNGRARATDGGNRLSGERIDLWVKGDRRMICEPNALLEIKGGEAIKMDGIDNDAEGDTEIRAERIVYDESNGLAEVIGNVRVRDPRAAMNCDQIRLYLKDDSEIDWIEALGEVIIQTDDRKALANRATYTVGEGKFTLEGEPMVKQGPNVMTGDRITVWIEPRRMVCEPNARVLLYLDEETKAKFLKDLNE